MAGKRYSNLDGVQTVRSFSDLRKWRAERAAKRKDLSYQVPQAPQVDLEHLHDKQAGPSVTWVGHSTFIIKYAGLTIVTDPVWAERMAFAKRLSPPGVAIRDIPEVDVVLLSHGHYDHLDFPSIRGLKGNPLFLVPAGLKHKFVRKGFKRTEEREWWESIRLGEVEFIFVPAQHWTRRTPWDTNASHWGGWVIRQAETSTERETAAAENAAGRADAELPVVYFAGDSGYFRGFQEIGRRFKPEYVLMPIGAFDPEWFMGPQHVSPEEAVQAFEDTGGRVFIPMHYGAFRLADDTPKEALDRFDEEWKRRGWPQERICRLDHGGTVMLRSEKLVVRL